MPTWTKSGSQYGTGVTLNVEPASIYSPGSAHGKEDDDDGVLLKFAPGDKTGWMARSKDCSAFVCASLNIVLADIIVLPSFIGTPIKPFFLNCSFT